MIHRNLGKCLTLENAENAWRASTEKRARREPHAAPALWNPQCAHVDQIFSTEFRVAEVWNSLFAYSQVL